MPEKLGDLLKDIKKKKSPKERDSFWQALSRYSILGILILLPILGSTILGYYLEKRFHLSRIYTLLFILAGPLIALGNLLFLYRRKK